VPAVGILGAQYLFTYARAVDPETVPYSAGIAIDPFRVFNFYSAPVFHLPKLVLSILFPLTVSSIYFDVARKDIVLGLAWVTFIIGAIYSYFFVEAGPVMLAGNFIWSG
jgi:hypothetical protein